MAKKSVTASEYRRMLAARQGRVKGRFQRLRPEQKVGYKAPRKPASAATASSSEAVANEIGLLEALIRQRKKLGIDTTELEKYVLGAADGEGVRSVVEDFIRDNQEQFNPDDPAGAAAFQLMTEAVNLSEDSLKADREEAKRIYAKLRFIRELAAKTKGRQSAVAKKLDEIIAPVEKQLKKKVSFAEFMRDKARDFRRSIPERIAARIPLVGGFLGEALRERRTQQDDLETYTGYLQEMISRRGRRSGGLDLGMRSGGRGSSFRSLGGAGASQLMGISGKDSTLGAIYKEVIRIRALMQGQGKPQLTESDAAELKAREAELEGMSKKASAGLGKTIIKSLSSAGSGFSSFISQVLSGLISSILGAAIMGGIGRLFSGLFGRFGNLLRSLFNSLRIGGGGVPGGPSGPIPLPGPTNAPVPLPSPTRPMLPPPGGSPLAPRPMLPPPGGGSIVPRGVGVGGGVGGGGLALRTLMLSGGATALVAGIYGLIGTMVGGIGAITTAAISDSLFGTDLLEYQLRSGTWTGSDGDKEKENEALGAVQRGNQLAAYKAAITNPQHSASELEMLPGMVREKMISGEDAIRRVIRYEAKVGPNDPTVTGGYTKDLKNRIMRADPSEYLRREGDALGITGEDRAKQRELGMQQQRARESMIQAEAEKAKSVAQAATGKTGSQQPEEPGMFSKFWNWITGENKRELVEELNVGQVTETINGRMSSYRTINNVPISQLSIEQLQSYYNRIKAVKDKDPDMPQLFEETMYAIEGELNSRRNTGKIKTPPSGQTTVGQMYSEYNSQRENLAEEQNRTAGVAGSIAAVDNSRHDNRTSNITNNFNDDIRIRNNEPTQKQMQTFSIA